MIATLFAAAAIGVLLGLRYRVWAALAASAVAVAAGGVLVYFRNASFWDILVTPLATMTALQCGYLAGLLAVAGLSRARRASALKRGAQAASPWNCWRRALRRSSRQ
jgi:hypothetical protein